VEAEIAAAPPSLAVTGWSNFKVFPLWAESNDGAPKSYSSKQNA